MHSFFHLYGLIIGSAISVGYWWGERILKQEKISIQLEKILVVVFAFGVVGARLYHLVTDWHLYVEQDWWQVFAIWNGGIGIIGALIGGAVGLWLILYWQKKLNYLWKIADIFAMALPISQAIGRWGNYINHELYGLPTSLFWGIEIPLSSRPFIYQEFTHFHPLFLYESCLSIGIFLLLNWIYRRKKWSIGSGKYFGSYLMLYSMVRFSLEFLRVETSRGGEVLSLFSVAQWMMIVLFFVGIFLLKKDR